jgi:hypothetical protein
MASEKTIEELGWDDQQSLHLRQVVSVLENQIAELFTDWRDIYGGPTSSLGAPPPQSVTRQDEEELKDYYRYVAANKLIFLQC